MVAAGPARAPLPRTWRVHKDCILGRKKEQKGERDSFRTSGKMLCFQKMCTNEKAESETQLAKEQDAGTGQGGDCLFSRSPILLQAPQDHGCDLPS